MKKPVTVRDRAGNIVQRADGVLLDGDTTQIPFMFIDHAATGGTSTVLAAGQRILGDAYDPAAFAGLGADAARHAIVKRRLGAVADGKPAAFLDAAWRTLAGDAAAAPARATGTGALSLSDAQRAVAQAGIKQAVADHAARVGHTPMRDAMEGHRAARSAILSDAWKGPARLAQEARYAGLSYEQRMSRRWQEA